MIDQHRPEGKKADNHMMGGAAFLVESMLLLLFLAVAMAVFLQIFGQSMERSRSGEELSQAIAAATSTAERFDDDPAKAEGSNEVDGLNVVCDVDEEPQSHGTLYRATIRVYGGTAQDAGAESEPLYTVSTAKYVSEVGQ